MEQAGPIGNVDVNFSMKNDLRNALKSVQADASEQEGLFLALKDAPLTNSMREAKYRAQQYSQNANEKWFCFSVVDTGNGMEPGQIEKLFRSDDKPTKKESGSAKVENTRLGMFVAVELCRRLGGFIACLSTPHAGTIFHVGIPVTMETGNTDTNVIAKPVKQPIIISGPITIVGDDTLGLKKQVMKQCERMRLDVEVIQVKSGREAVDKFSGDRTPSVLIIGKFRMQKQVNNPVRMKKTPRSCNASIFSNFPDYDMPEMDGLETMARVRKAEFEGKLQPSYIVSLTTDLTDNVSTLFMSAGGNEVMMNPPAQDFLPHLVGRFEVEKATASEVLSNFLTKKNPAASQ